MESSSSVPPSTRRPPPRNSKTSNGGFISMKRDKGLKAIVEEACVDNDEEDGDDEHEEEEDKISHTVLMTQCEKDDKGTSLHDMTCVGVDTCSAKSISCDPEDFLFLRMAAEDNVLEQLRGVGGSSRVAGKGVLVFYAKALDGSTKAVIEPKGIYLVNPSAEFRILGQQRMKKQGLNLIQDYDEAGSDVLKCKRSDLILPLEEGEGILLLRTFKHQPDEVL